MKTSGRTPEGHFPEEDWLDLARRMAGAERAASLLSHLDTGCRKCSAALRLWQGAVEVARREADYRPPEGALRAVKTQFSRQRPLRPLERAARAVSLVLDSFQQPLAAGVRMAGPSARQLLYRAGRYSIKLLVEPIVGSERLSVVGQIQDVEDPQNGLQDLAVFVVKGKEALSWTFTNALGEFQLEPDAAENLRLSVRVPRVGPLIVPLLVGVKGPGNGAGGGALAASGRRTRARQQ